MEDAALFLYPPPAIYMLHDLDGTSIKNNNILACLIKSVHFRKKYFCTSALTFLELGAPTDRKNCNGDSLLDYNIQEYNKIKANGRASWQEAAKNLGAFISMLFYIDEHKIDFKKTLGLIKPEYRNEFKQKYCESFRDQSALHFFFIKKPKPNLTNPFRLLPSALQTKLASYVGSPWQGRLKKRRELNQLEYQLQLAEQKKEKNLKRKKNQTTQ